MYMQIIHAFLLFHSINAYQHLSLDSHEVCSLLTKRHLKLGPGNKSAMVFTQNRLSDHAIDWEKNSLCKFQVKSHESSPRPSGIFAVIQDIQFRKNETTQKCIDYVQFKRRDGYVSEQICGTSNAALTMDKIFLNAHLHHDSYITNNSFVAPDDELDIVIFVNKQALKYYETTDITIVVTAYKSCLRASENDRPCSAYQKECIYKEFINDGYINCPYINCYDENGCLYKDATGNSIKRESIGNKVLIGSVTTMLLTFSLFICCIYICRKYDKFCWSEEFATGSTTSIPNVLSGRQENVGHRLSMEAPPSSVHSNSDAHVQQQQQQSTTNADDKDLPPSYESLFPSR